MKKPEVAAMERYVRFVELHEEVNVTLWSCVASSHGAENIKTLDP
jgi:hypothetical protein